MDRKERGEVEERERDKRRGEGREERRGERKREREREKERERERERCYASGFEDGERGCELRNWVAFRNWIKGGKQFSPRVSRRSTALLPS
jgi:hypothetical protein